MRGQDDAGEWKPVSRGALAAWLAAYALFLWYAARDTEGFLFIDHANLVFHEAGHMFFSWFGHTLMILGGTLGELIVPLCVGIYFYLRRETAGVAFASFWFFENFLYIGTYMADARAEALPLVGVGDTVDHDWNILFSQWGVLLQDTRIGGTTRWLGGCGMLATMAWLVWMHLRTAE
ncbi:MAG TPA: hypothetical protein VL099_17130 [Candidatus Binatia bacterium]|nr:hypothetical protein [Candidatus Binatia bacterium]